MPLRKCQGYAAQFKKRWLRQVPNTVLDPAATLRSLKQLHTLKPPAPWGHHNVQVMQGNPSPKTGQGRFSHRRPGRAKSLPVQNRRLRVGRFDDLTEAATPIPPDGSRNLNRVIPLCTFPFHPQETCRVPWLNICPPRPSKHCGVGGAQGYSSASTFQSNPQIWHAPAVEIASRNPCIVV